MTIIFYSDKPTSSHIGGSEDEGVRPFFWLQLRRTGWSWPLPMPNFQMPKISEPSSPTILGQPSPTSPPFDPPVPSNLFDLLHLIHSVVMEFSANLQFFWIWYYLPAGYQLAEMGFPWTMQNLSVGQWMWDRYMHQLHWPHCWICHVMVRCSGTLWHGGICSCPNWYEPPMPGE